MKRVETELSEEQVVDDGGVSLPGAEDYKYGMPRVMEVEGTMPPGSTPTVVNVSS